MSENKEIKDFGTNTEVSKESGIQILTIIGQIEGHYILPDGQKASSRKNQPKQSPHAAGVGAAMTEICRKKCISQRR